MRVLLIFFCLIVSGAFAFAQEQEGKLLDRLLKPNTSLGNSAQNKRFSGNGYTTRKASSSPYVFTDQTRTRKYASTREVDTGSYLAHPFAKQNVGADISSRSGFAGRTTAYETKAAQVAPHVSDRDRSVATSDYSQNHAFLARGKSQKALSAQSHPLTVDEVRELLNRNK